MKDIVRIERNTSQRFTIVEWTLGNKCTYACSYCPEILHDGSAGWHDHEKLTAFLDACRDHYGEMGREVMVQYTGGEPTVYPKFKELVRYANEKGIRQSIISNGSRTPRFWGEIAGFFEKVHLSFHPEYALEETDNFIRVSQEICRQTDLHVNVLMKPGLFPEIISFCSNLKVACPHATILLKPLQKDFGEELYDYSKSEQTILERMHGFQTTAPRRKNYPTGQLKATHRDGREDLVIPATFIMEGTNKWEGWHCNIGVETLSVDMWGNIHGGLCRVGGSHGNIYEGGYTLPSESAVCTREWCTCHLDIMVTKSESPL